LTGTARPSWASQYAVARRGGPGGPDAGCAVVALSRRCPVRASSVPRVAAQLIGVRCPVRVSERPGVQCPASGLRRPGWPSGVRAFERPLCPTAMRSWSVAVGHVHNGTSARGWSVALEAGAGRAGRAAGQLRLGRRRERWLSSGRFDRMVDRERLDGMREDGPSVGSWRRPRCVVSV
jgi:hypothetical protein